MLGLRYIGLFLFVLGLVQATVSSRSLGLKQRSTNDNLLPGENATNVSVDLAHTWIISLTSYRQQHALNGSIIYPIPGSSMTLHFSESGEDLPVEEVQLCLLKAVSWIAQQLSYHQDDPMKFRTFRHNSILLKIYPRKAMLCSLAANIIAAWSEFITRGGRAFATQVTVTDGTLGYLGYMDLSNVAPGSASSASTNISSVQLVKPGEAAADLISDGSVTAGPRPPNNYKVRLPETTYVRLSMNNYGQDLPAANFLAVLLDIQMTVISHIIISGGGSYVGDIQRWRDGDVKFQIAPLRLTWLTLAQLVEAIHTKVVDSFGTFEFEFDVSFNGPRATNKLGVGFVRQQQS